MISACTFHNLTVVPFWDWGQGSRLYQASQSWIEALDVAAAHSYALFLFICVQILLFVSCVSVSMTEGLLKKIVEVLGHETDQAVIDKITRK